LANSNATVLPMLPAPMIAIFFVSIMCDVLSESRYIQVFKFS